MIARPASMLDVEHVRDTLWKRGRQELDALGVDRRVWTNGWAQRIRCGDAVAFDSHAILGCDWESEHVINTSFQASISFEEPGVGKAVTKALRAEIPRLMKERGIRVVCTYSLCVDPEAPKWFRLLGLNEDTTFKGAKFGPYTARRFVRRA